MKPASAMASSKSGFSNTRQRCRGSRQVLRLTNPPLISSEVGPELARGLARLEERSVKATSKLGRYLELRSPNSEPLLRARPRRRRSDRFTSLKLRPDLRCSWRDGVAHQQLEHGTHNLSAAGGARRAACSGSPGQLAQRAFARKPIAPLAPIDAPVEESDGLRDERLALRQTL